MENLKVMYSRVQTVHCIIFTLILMPEVSKYQNIQELHWEGGKVMLLIIPTVKRVESMHNIMSQ